MTAKALACIISHIMTSAAHAKVVIIHGTKGSPQCHWFPWLKGELEQRGYSVSVPSMPTPEGQSLLNWWRVFNENVGTLHSSSILVGHSLGAVFALRLLEASTIPVAKVVLVSGFVRSLGLPEYDALNSSFVADAFDWARIRAGARQIICFAGENDPYVPIEQSRELAKSLEISLRLIKGGGHLNHESGFNEFPMALEAIINNESELLPLRPNVCMLVFNKAGKLFLGERHREAGVWQFPQGGVEAQYSLEENVIRELEEELGVKPNQVKIVKKLNATHDYEFGNPPAYAMKKWRGQSQTFWLVEFLGADTDIRVDQQNPEFSNWKWCSVSEIYDLAESKRLPGYANPLKEFEEYLKTTALP